MYYVCILQFLAEMVRKSSLTDGVLYIQEQKSLNRMVYSLVREAVLNLLEKWDSDWKVSNDKFLLQNCYKEL